MGGRAARLGLGAPLRKANRHFSEVDPNLRHNANDLRARRRCAHAPILSTILGPRLLSSPHTGRFAGFCSSLLSECCCSAVAVLLQCAPMRRRRRQATLRAAERSSSSCGNYVEGEQTAAHQRFGVGPVVHGLKQLRADHAVEAKLHSELLKEPDVRVHQHGRKIEHAAGKDRPAAEGGRRRIMDEEGA